jgi:hypothetical protein
MALKCFLVKFLLGLGLALDRASASASLTYLPGAKYRSWHRHEQ